MKLKNRSEEIEQTPYSDYRIIDMIEEGTKENITIENAIRKYKIDKTTTGEEFNFNIANSSNEDNLI
jgi:hypothetical protein